MSVLAFFIFLAAFLLGLSIDLKELYREVRKRVARGTRKMEQKGDRAGVTGKLLEATEVLIQRSNIRMYMTYNVWLHLALCLGLSIGAYSFISRYLGVVTSTSFAIVMLLIPYALLQLIADYTGMKEKKHAIDFLIILKNFFRAGKNDIFDAFEKAAKYISQPLKSHIELMIYEYNHKINAVTCLKNFKQKLSTSELQLYIENLEICYVQGGDIVALTDTFINELSNLDEDDDKQDTEDRILNYGLYILLALNFTILSWIIGSVYKKQILDSLWGQMVFILDMVISMYIIYMTFERE